MAVNSLAGIYHLVTSTGGQKRKFTALLYGELLSIIVDICISSVNLLQVKRSSHSGETFLKTRLMWWRLINLYFQSESGSYQVILHIVLGGGYIPMSPQRRIVKMVCDIGRDVYIRKIVPVVANKTNGP